MPAPTALHCDFIISAHSLQAFKVNEADWKWSWTSGYSGAYKCAYCAHHAVQAAHWPQCCRLPPALVPRPHSPPPPALAALRPPAPSPAALHPATVLLNLLICFHRVKCHHFTSFLPSRPGSASSLHGISVHSLLGPCLGPWHHHPQHCT